MPSEAAEPISFLPLTPFAFQVLLALADGPRHGYAIIKEVEERSAGAVRLRTGTLYTLLQRLLASQLISEPEAAGSATTLEPGGPAARADSRRRYYELTVLGDAVLRAEAQRLEGLIGDARRKHVLSDAGGV